MDYFLAFQLSFKPTVLLKIGCSLVECVSAVKVARTLELQVSVTCFILNSIFFNVAVIQHFQRVGIKQFAEVAFVS